MMIIHVCYKSTGCVYRCFAPAWHSDAQLFWGKISCSLVTRMFVGAFRRQSAPIVADGYWAKATGLLPKGKEGATKQDWAYFWRTFFCRRMLIRPVMADSSSVQSPLW